MSFSVDVARIARDLNEDLDVVCRQTKVRLFNGVIRDTRVDTGRLRGNWQTSTGSPIMTEIDRIDPTPQGQDGGVSQDDAIDTVEAFSIDYLTNNLPYAEVWEESDGGIAKNMARIQRYTKEAVDDVR